MKSTFEAAWARIGASQGQTFRQLRGGEFTYEVSAGSVRPDRTNQAIPRSHFERAWELVPLADTTAVQSLRGPSYIYAILMDQRIAAGEW